jgi:hypothetical protein
MRHRWAIVVPIKRLTSHEGAAMKKYILLSICALTLAACAGTSGAQNQMYGELKGGAEVTR